MSIGGQLPLYIYIYIYIYWEAGSQATVVLMPMKTSQQGKKRMNINSFYFLFF